MLLLPFHLKFHFPNCHANNSPLNKLFLFLKYIISLEISNWIHHIFCPIAPSFLEHLLHWTLLMGFEGHYLVGASKTKSNWHFMVCVVCCLSFWGTCRTIKYACLKFFQRCGLCKFLSFFFVLLVFFFSCKWGYV